MLPAASGGFRGAEHWHWPGGIGEEAGLSLRSAFMLQETQHIVDLDAERRGASGANAAGEDLAIPDWLIADTRAWVVGPVLHFQRMIAIAVLYRPGSEEQTSELQSPMRRSYDGFCLKKKKKQ